MSVVQRSVMWLCFRGLGQGSVENSYLPDRSIQTLKSSIEYCFDCFDIRKNQTQSWDLLTLSSARTVRVCRFHFPFCGSRREMGALLHILYKASVATFGAVISEPEFLWNEPRHMTLSIRHFISSSRRGGGGISGMAAAVGPHRCAGW